jgi:hypothetical protein
LRAEFFGEHFRLLKKTKFVCEENSVVTRVSICAVLLLS